MLITLTGNLGSGKSTICNILRESCGYETYSTGKVLRGMAAERGIDILEMNKLCISDPKYDKMIDDAVTKIADERRNDKLVFDSRLAWHFAGHSFKVFLSVALDEAANRVFNDALRGDVEKYASVEDARRDLKDRADTEDKRYRDFYNLEYFNMNNYDLVLDSTCATSEQLAKIILEEHDRYYGLSSCSGDDCSNASCSGETGSNASCSGETGSSASFSGETGSNAPCSRVSGSRILLSVNRLMYENGVTKTLAKTEPSGEIFDEAPVSVHLEEGIYKVDSGIDALKRAWDEKKTFISVKFI